MPGRWHARLGCPGKACTGLSRKWLSSRSQLVLKRKMSVIELLIVCLFVWVFTTHDYVGVFVVEDVEATGL